MIIRNGNVFQEDGSYRKMDLYVENGRIVSSEEEVSDKEEIDASGLKVLPGLVDIHSHGAVGHDFSDADATGLKKILKYEKAHGITSYCPTSMTLPMEQLIRIFASATEVEQNDSCARIVGLNMEGPFLDPAKKGAHVEEYIRKPDIRFFRECQEASGGMIKVVTVAPNMEGAEAFIEALKDDVVISIGHTGADYDCAAKAMEKGAHHVTHLYNAMNPLGHRAPGVIAAAADDPLCMAEMIGDGIHIHPAMVRATFEMMGADRMILISDSMRATGMPDGQYTLGGLDVKVVGKRATLVSDGAIAGSATNLADCMRTVVKEMQIPLETAIACATIHPAKSLGIDDQYGSIKAGKKADIVLLKENLDLQAVIKDGVRL